MIGIIRKIAILITLKLIDEAKTIILNPDFPQDSCESCPENCPLSQIGGWDMYEIIEESAPLSHHRSMGIIERK